MNHEAESENVNVEVEPGDISDLDVEWTESNEESSDDYLDVEWTDQMKKVVMTLKRMLFLMWMTLMLKN